MSALSAERMPQVPPELLQLLKEATALDPETRPDVGVFAARFSRL